MSATNSHRGNDPIPLGTAVKPWGTVASVAYLQGERYYFFVEKGVAMIPASIVEHHQEVNRV